MKLKAIHTIRRTLVPGVAGDPKNGVRATPPKTEEIAPGQVFEAKPEEANDYFKVGAAVCIGEEGPFLAPKKAEPASVKKVEPIPVKKDEPEEDTGPDSSLSEETSESSQGDSDTASDPAADESDEEDLVG